MHSVRKLLTLLHNDLYYDIGEVSPSHLTVNLLSRSISGQFRIVFEKSHALTTFAVTPERCIGTLLVEADGHYWLEPRLFSWSTLEQYLDLFQHHPASDPLSWKTLLRRFASVEVVRFDQSSDVIEILNISGQALIKLKQIMKHIKSFT